VRLDSECKVVLSTERIRKGCRSYQKEGLSLETRRGRKIRSKMGKGQEERTEENWTEIYNFRIRRGGGE